jgi:hypothetical protein
MEHTKLVYLNDQRREIRAAADFASEIVGLGRASAGCPLARNVPKAPPPPRLVSWSHAA